MSYTDEILDFQEQERRENPELYLADKGLRFANYMLDSIFVNILYYGIGFLIEALSLQVGIMDESAVIPLMLLLILIGLCYWIIAEYYFGKTLAKFITRTKVVTTSGKLPSFWQIVGRTLARYIPFEPFSFFGSKPIGWHDSLSNTLVVKDTYPTRDTYLSRDENSYL